MDFHLARVTPGDDLSCPKYSVFSYPTLPYLIYQLSLTVHSHHDSTLPFTISPYAPGPPPHHSHDFILVSQNYNYNHRHRHHHHQQQQKPCRFKVTSPFPTLPLP